MRGHMKHFDSFNTFYAITCKLVSVIMCIINQKFHLFPLHMHFNNSIIYIYIYFFSSIKPKRLLLLADFLYLLQQWCGANDNVEKEQNIEKHI
jgi:hypothetical protein